MMANDNLKREENPPDATSLSHNNEELDSHIVNEGTDFSRTFHDHNGTGANTMAFPHKLLPFFPLPCGDSPQLCSQEMPQTGTSFLTDVSQFNNTQNPKIDHNFTYGNGNDPLLCRPMSDLSSFGGNMNKLSPFSCYDSSGSLNNVRNAYVNSLQKPQIDRKLENMSSSSAGVIQMITQDGEATDSSICMPQLRSNFINHGVSKPVLSHNPDGEELGIKNSVMISGVESNYTENLDGSFLNLGVGGNTEAISQSIVSDRNITGSTGRVIPPQFNTSLTQKVKSSSLNHGLNKVGLISSFQNNVGGMPTLVHNVGGSTSCNNDLEVMSATSTGCSSSPSCVLQTPRIDKLHHVSTSRNMNLGLGVRGNWDARFSNVDPNHEVQGYPVISTKPLVSSQPGMPDPGQGWATGLPLLPSLIRSTTQPASDHPLKCYLESSIASPSTGLAGSTPMQGKSGRLGRPKAIGPVQFSKIEPASTTGQGIPGYERNLTAQTSSDLVGPSLKRSATGLLAAAIPSRRRKTRKPRPSIPPSVPTLSPSIPSLPNLAQTASAPPPPQITSAPSCLPHPGTIVSSQLNKAPPLPPLPQTTASHIKWKGFNQTPQPIGGKCFLCKRNLSFTPDGPFFQPANPPAAAVLPCTHTFHEHCLQLITPEDQASNPPCIPCAIGES
ncbi:uncharacterized protein LOC132187563 isoform X1 [Corylus avellana]|uniref:uncharacterized protein LOC132187563 isoform X1 n=2 Tax=Corylus avellana TaxID=13451 RepID=UPI00286BF2EA|nr:uncharacterized protein LOC132187563 isoform X1 [Corylus avellana]